MQNTSSKAVSRVIVRVPDRPTPLLEIAQSRGLPKPFPWYNLCLPSILQRPWKSAGAQVEVLRRTLVPTTGSLMQFQEENVRVITIVGPAIPF